MPVSQNTDREAALGYYGLLNEIGFEYYYEKKTRLNKNNFILYVFEAIEPNIEDQEIKDLFKHLNQEEKQSLTFRLNFYLHNLDLKRNVFAGLTFKTLAEKMMELDITNQQAYLKHSQPVIETLIGSAKGSEYELKRTKIENAMQDLIWNRVVKGALNLTDSVSEKSLSKKELLERLRICEEKAKK